jgi:hypothetical protein
MKSVRDLTIAISKNEVPVKNKGSKFVRYLSGLIDAPVDFEMDWEPGEGAFDLMQDSFWEETPLEFEFLDDTKEKGGKGLTGEFIVTKLERTEPIEDVMSASVSLRLAADSEVEPTWT